MVAIDITHSSNGLACWRIYQSSSKSYLSNLCGQLAIVCLNSCRDLQTILICCDMSFWWACVVRVFLNFWVFLGSQEFLPPCTFRRCLVCLQSSRHTSCYDHRHGLTQTCRRNGQICHRGGISQKHKSRLYCDVPQEKRERCGCKWGDEVGMNDIPFTISRGGAHCGAGNMEAGCKLFKLPVYRAFLPDNPPPHPCLTYWITKFIEMLFSK